MSTPVLTHPAALRDTPANVLFRLAIALLMSSLVLLLHRAHR
jgi:hypothetical protein